jgi:hypothetical protein
MEIFEQQGGRCALSGVKMTWMNERIRPTSISIDRIDSSRGYSRDNVRLLCHSVNRMKGDATDGDVLEIAKAIVARMEKTSEPTWQPFPAFTNESHFMVLH